MLTEGTVKALREAFLPLGDDVAGKIKQETDLHEFLRPLLAGDAHEEAVAILDGLAKSPNELVRFELARLDLLPASTLKILKKDKDELVKHTLSQREATV